MSNYNNPYVIDKDGFKDYILESLGAPLVTVELADEHLEIAIANAMDYYTKFCPTEKEYLAVNLTGYVEDTGLTLPSNVISCFSLDDYGVGGQGDVNRLFTVGNTMLNYGFISVPFNTAGYGWVNWHMFYDHIDLVRRMLGGGFQWSYNNRRQLLKLYPDPIKMDMAEGNWIVMGCNVLRSDDLMYGEEKVRRLALAEAKIILGTVRGKYDGTQLLGGATINSSIREEGIAERDALRQEIYDEQGPCSIFVG